MRLVTRRSRTRRTSSLSTDLVIKSPRHLCLCDDCPYSFLFSLQSPHQTGGLFWWMRCGFEQEQHLLTPSNFSCLTSAYRISAWRQPENSACASCGGIQSGYELDASNSAAYGQWYNPTQEWTPMGTIKRRGSREWQQSYRGCTPICSQHLGARATILSYASLAVLLTLQRRISPAHLSRGQC